MFKLTHKIFIPLLLFLLLIASNHVLALPDNVINYQGKLTNASDVAVADGSYDFTFTIWDASTGGNCVWSARGTCGSPTAKSVAVSKGIFSTALGEASDNVINLDFNSNYYLQVQVGTDSPMDVRKQITASGFAINSSRLNGQLASFYLDTSATEQTKSGALTVQGNMTVGDSNSDALIVYGGNSSGDIRSSAGALNLSPLAGSNLNVNLGTTGDFTVNTNQFYVDTSSGNVGIGTASPSGLLHLASNLAAFQMFIDSYSDTTPAAGLIMRSARGTAALPTALQTDNILGGIAFRGYGATGFATGARAYIGGNAAENWTDSAQGTYLKFLTTPIGSATNTERMRILDNGNVGIGTTTPTAVLHLKAGTATAGTAPLKFTSGTNLTTPEAGAMEWDGTSLYISQTSGPTRKTIAYTDSTMTGTFDGINLGTGTQGGVGYFSSTTQLTSSALGTTGQTLISGGTGAPTWYAPTAGSLLFAGTSGILAQDNSNLFWDNANKRLGIGTTDPNVGDFGSTLTVYGSGTGAGIITAARNVNGVNWGTGFQSVLNNSAGNPTTYSYFNGYIISNTAGSESGGSAFYTKKTGTLTEQMRIDNNGNIGIGTTTPTAVLHLKAGTATANTAPLKFTSGTNLTTPEAGAIEWDGTSLYISQTSGPTRKTIAYTDSAMTGTFDGINLATGAQGGVGYFSSTTQLSSSALGTTGRALISGGTGAPTWYAPTAGSILFAGTSGILAQDNSNLFWDDANNRLGIGTAAPESSTHIVGSTANLLFVDRNDNSAGAASVKMRKIRGTSIVQNGDYLFSMEGWGYDGATYRRGSYIASLVNGAPSSGVMPTELAFAVNSGGTDPTERMRITSVGNVGIGTTSPSELLHIESSVSGATVLQIESTSDDAVASRIKFVKDSLSPADDDALGVVSFYGNDDGGTETQFANIYTRSTDVTDATEDSTMFFRTMEAGTLTDRMVIAGSSVGIGTTTPLLKLSIEDNASQILEIKSTGSSSLGAGAGLRLFNDDGAAQANGDRLGYLNFGGARDASHTLQGGASIAAMASENWSSTATGTDLVFNTVTNATTTQSEKMRITNAGYIGIGTTEPDWPLTMYKENSYSGINIKQTGAGDYYAGIRASTDDSNYNISAYDDAYSLVSEYSGKTVFQATGGDLALVNFGTDDIEFYTGGRAAENKKMVINSSGNVGIGTTSPNYKLEVNAGATSTEGIAVLGSDYPTLRAVSTSSSGGQLDLQSSTGRWIFYSEGTDLRLFNNAADRVTFKAGGNVGIGTITPTAYLNIKAGTATAGTAPLKFTSGTNLTTAEAGAMEWDGTSLYISQTSGPTRKTLAYTDSTMTGTFDGINLATGTQGGVGYFSSTTQLSSSALGTTGRALISGGTGAPTWYAPTSGSILFAGTSGILAQDNSNLFWDDANKILGIGTTNPSNEIRLGEKLAIATSANYGGQAISTYSTTNTHAGILEFNKSSTNTLGDQTGIVDDSEALGHITFRGSDGTSLNQAAFIGAYVDGTAVTNNVPGRIEFVTTAAGGVQASRLSIKNNGNIIMGVNSGGSLGIGTTTPSAYLNIKAGTATAGTAPLKFTSGTNLTTAEAGVMEYDGTQLFFSPSTTRNILAQVSGATALTTGSIPFATTNGYLTQDNSNLFWDNTNKRLGIGTASPGANLDVIGIPRFERAFDTDGNTSRQVMSLYRTYAGGAGADGIGAHIDFFLETETEGTNVPSGQIKVVATDATAGSIDSDISLIPYENGSSNSDAFLLKSDGRAFFSVPESEQWAFFQVKANSRSVFDWSNSDTNTHRAVLEAHHSTDADMVDGFGSSIDFSIRDNANVWNDIAYISGVRDGADNQGSLSFNVRNGGSWNANAMWIDPTGYVGIGTSSPSSKLDITTAGLNTTQTDTSGLALASVTSGSSNQISPALRWSGYGYASMVDFYNPINFRSYVVPTGTTGLSGYLTFESAVGGAAYANRFNILTSGNVGIGTIAPTAVLHLKAGTATAGTAPLKFTSGTNLTTPTAGAMEYDGTNLYFTPSTSRRTIAFTDSTMTGTFDGINLATGTQGGVGYFSSTTQLSSSALGTAGRALISGGTGAPTWYAPTAGSILFAGASGILAQDNSNLFWDNTNKILGIGTATPATESRVGEALVIVKSGDYGGASINTYASNGALAGNIDFNKSHNDTIGAQTAVVDGEGLGYIGFRGSNGTAFQNAAYIGGYADGTVSATSMPGRLEFFTTPDGTNTITSRMVIKNSGYVGIGTATPIAKLDVSGSGGANSMVRAINSSTANLGAKMWAGSDGSGKLALGDATATDSVSINGVGSSYFTGGNVGIGTTTPTANFQVAQNTTATGTVTITGNTTCTGTGTQFTNTFKVGDSIIITATAQTRVISAITSDTVMTIASATNTAGSAYTLAGGTRFSVLGNGNVGIGTTTPGLRSIAGGSNYFNLSSNSTSDIMVDTTSSTGWAFFEQTNDIGNALAFGNYGSANTQTGWFGTGTTANKSYIFTYPSMPLAIGTIASENLTLGTANTARMTILGTGNIGIGTTSPTAPLDVSAASGNSLANISTLGTGYARLHFRRNGIYIGGIGSDANGVFGLNGGDNVVNQLSIDSAGNVGIGTTSPVVKLHVVGSSTMFRVENTDGTTANQFAGMGLKAGTANNFIWSNNQNSSGFFGGSSSLNIYTGQDSPIAFFTNGNNERMRINGNGNVGIGTATPVTQLEIYSTIVSPSIGEATGVGQLRLDNNATALSSTGGIEFKVAGDSSGYGSKIQAISSGGSQLLFAGRHGSGTWSEHMRINSSGYVGIGTASPTAPLEVKTLSTTIESRLAVFTAGNNRSLVLLQPDNADNNDPFTWITGNAFSWRVDAIDALNITAGGLIGIGTTSPTAQLHTTSTVRFANFGAGTLVTDASGNVSVSSDERLKNINGNFTRGIEDLMGLNPISFNWQENSGMDLENSYVGFSAQNVQQYIPEAVGEDSQGFLTLSDRPILATAVNSIKVQQEQILGISENVSELSSVNQDLILKTDGNISTIAELQKSIDENLEKISNSQTSIFEQVASQIQSIESLQAKTGDQENRIKSIEDMLAILQNKFNDFKEPENQELILAQIDLNRTEIDYLNLILGLDGTRKPGDIKMGGQLEAKKIVAETFAVEASLEKNKSIGTVEIKTGEKSIVVETEAVNENSKIFITPDQPVGVGIGLVKNGESFEIETSVSVEKDLKINWWIVDEE